MAIGWISLLKIVPWGDVIASAPAVADGAKKLWDAAKRKPAGAPADQPEYIAPDEMQTRVLALEARVAELHEQMRASSELIKALAEQNTQLIRRAEASRVRQLWLTAALVAVAGLWLVNFLIR